MRVSSSDGVEVAVHELRGADDLPTLLISHATGFHAHCYVPIASELWDRFHSVGLDYRGHGATEVDRAWHADWTKFGDDALAVTRQVAAGGPVVGFGHSMGGSALLMAAHRAPELFDRLVLFEPISHEATTPAIASDEIRRLPIVQSALRRRRTFESFDAAYENFRAKPPLSTMVPEALRYYVDHGFRPTVDDRGEPVVELRCDPELEAEIFVTGRTNGVWDLLPGIATPCILISGHVEQAQPSAQTAAIADRLPNGEYVLLDHQTHFGPFSHPQEIATLIDA
jgi:pimeloyl-ACP methyl ester carboxylesterase